MESGKPLSGTKKSVCEVIWKKHSKLFLKKHLKLFKKNILIFLKKYLKLFKEYI